jgi:hypothetical protein
MKDLSVTDIINAIIILGNISISCDQPCSSCKYDPFCKSFFRCYKQAIKYSKEECHE